jgi:LmbE family N-acetylglucosaminyl deacetylase
LTVNTLLAVFAHPDDESLVAGGTLKACSESGLTTIVICLTLGEQGAITEPNLATRETLGTVRECELRAACETLGVTAVECFDYPDGALVLG